jgi:hypothetical protein
MNMNKLLRHAVIGAALTSCTLASSAFAQNITQTAATQTVAAGDLATLFPSLVAEARSKRPSSSDVGMINTHLAMAEWHWAKGEQRQALSYLNFVRGKLNLRLVSADPSVQQAGRPAALP